MSPPFDALLVGAGPAGCGTARLLASEGYRVGVLEEHASSGVPTQCAGLITDSVIRMSGVSPKVYNALHGAEVIFPDGRSVVVRSSEPKARVVDRADLDRRMAEAAADAGAEIFYGDRYLGHSVSADGVEVRSSSGTRGCRAIVGADGHSSAVADSLGSNRAREYVRGIQADVAVRMERRDLFRIRLGSRYAPGFFSWEIPCGEFTRVGLCASWSAGPPVRYLKSLLSDHYGGAEIVSKYCGKIPLGGRRAIAGERCLLIGDAASQVKPVSGGGLYPAFLAAPILADVLSSALESDDLSARSLRRYQGRCRSAFGKDLERAFRLRRLFLRLDDDDLCRAGEYCSRESVRSILDDIDIDDPGKVVGRIARTPSALPGLIPLALRCFF